MKNFAVIEEGTVINIIVADSKEDAEKYSKKQCIEIVDTFVDINYTFNEEENVFIQPKPYPSYVLNANNVWESPISKPNDEDHAYYWNEEERIWEEFVPPTEKPDDGKKYHYINGSWTVVVE